MNGLRTDETLQDDRIAVGGSLSHAAQARSKVIAAAEKLLFALFLLTLPLCNPWVRGDGVGYYAYIRSALIDHDLQFENDYLQANRSFLQAHSDAQGRLLPQLYTKTGYVDNHFSVGPAILWAPVMIAVHVAVVLADHFGAQVAADGWSRPYLVAMALTTACYGFLSLLLAFQLARKYFRSEWAFPATVGIWLASSLPIYMYFNPSWSHALSAFSVSLFLWYWDKTRENRAIGQWAILGLLAGLMGNVYYPNAILLMFPGLEAVRDFTGAARAREGFFIRLQKPAVGNGVFLSTFALALLPTFVTRLVIYGSIFTTGYPSMTTWNWKSPVLFKVLFSSDHGMFSWTPILILAVAGMYFLIKRDALLGMGSLLTFLAYYYFISSYPDWDGISSFGNRFFVSLTPVFILGLTALLSSFSDWLGPSRQAAALTTPVLALLIAWNIGFIFQWGTHMVPARGEISWGQMVHNQVVEVPQRMMRNVQAYFTNRGEMMKRLEEQDIEQQNLEEKRGQ